MKTRPTRISPGGKTISSCHGSECTVKYLQQLAAGVPTAAICRVQRWGVSWDSVRDGGNCGGARIPYMEKVVDDEAPRVTTPRGPREGPSPIAREGARVESTPRPRG